MMLSVSQETEAVTKVPLFPEQAGTCAIPDRHPDASLGRHYGGIHEEDYLSYLLDVLPNETVGNQLHQYRWVIESSRRITDTALRALRHADDYQVAQRAKRVLSIIQEHVDFLKRLGVDWEHLPPLRAFNVDDGSVLIEWISETFRVGFSIERDKEESSWYVVTNRGLGEISASGYLFNTDIETIVIWLLVFVFLYSGV